MKRSLIAILALAAATPALQGCFPLAVTGVGATALVAADRRTTGIYIEDENIEWKVFARGRDFPSAHINATSFNRHVLLTGEAPAEDLRKQIEARITERDQLQARCDRLKKGIQNLLGQDEGKDSAANGPPLSPSPAAASVTDGAVSGGGKL